MMQVVELLRHQGLDPVVFLTAFAVGCDDVDTAMANGLLGWIHIDFEFRHNGEYVLGLAGGNT